MWSSSVHVVVGGISGLSPSVIGSPWSLLLLGLRPSNDFIHCTDLVTLDGGFSFSESESLGRRRWPCCCRSCRCSNGLQDQVSGTVGLASVLGSSNVESGWRCCSLDGCPETEGKLSSTLLISSSRADGDVTSPLAGRRPAGRSLVDVGLVLGPGWGPESSWSQCVSLSSSGPLDTIGGPAPAKSVSQSV